MFHNFCSVCEIISHFFFLPLDDQFNEQEKLIQSVFFHALHKHVVFYIKLVQFF